MRGIAGGTDPGASSVALRAPCDAPGSEELFPACIRTFDCGLIVIPTSLLTDFSGVGVAGHIGTGGRVRLRAWNALKNLLPRAELIESLADLQNAIRIADISRIHGKR